MAKVVLKNVNKIYNEEVHAVKDANIIAEDKEFVILVGPSGCGKSTTLRMVAGLEEVTSGEIYIGDRLVNEVQPKDRDIAMVFQNYALYPHMTVFDNMAFALKLRKVSKTKIKKQVEHSAKLLGIEELLERKPKELSGGQRQRVALGRAIVRDPKVFLFDEPLSNLDAKLRVQMRAEISKLHRKLSTTMIYVTHDQVEAMTMADKIVILKDGYIQQIDTPLEVYDHPKNLFVAGFIGSPAINEFKGQLEKRNNKIYFKNDKIALQISHEKEVKDYIGKEVIMGIRPEGIYDARFDSMAEEPQATEALCEVVEPMGNEFVVYFSIKKKDFTARFDPKKLPQVNKNLKITFDMKKAHYFDIETEEAIV